MKRVAIADSRSNSKIIADSSAHVEIERHRSRELETLATWRSRLLGLAGAPSSSGSDAELPPVNLHDRASVLRRLDALHMRVGQFALNQPLPPVVERSQQVARQAVERLLAAEKELASVEATLHVAVGRAETMQARAAAARDSAAVEQARTQANFARLVLGRELAQCLWQPQQSLKELSEARELQRHLADTAPTA